MVFGVLFGFRRSDFRSSDYFPSKYVLAVILVDEESSRKTILFD
jgi:hypothetical protein